jgi:hypothetical protein
MQGASLPGIIIRTIGVVQLLVGAVAAFYGPLEIYVFYFFSRNGRFQYDGFGFGSLWFGLLVIQNIGYYIIAALLLPTGYATLRRRRWALPLSRLILWLWLGGGFVALLNLVILAPAFLQSDLARNVLLLRLGITAVFIIVVLIFLPLLLMRFYRLNPIAEVFAADKSAPTWIERLPFSLLVLYVLLGGVLIGLHLAQFFQAMFPVFGRLVLGRAGAYIISACVVLLVGLVFGLAKRQVWAWWGAMAYFSLLTVSAFMTFSLLPLAEIFRRMNLPEYEVAFLAEAAILQDYRLVWLLAVPLLVILGLLIYVKRYFGSLMETD